MSLKFKIQNKVRVPVVGKIADEDGSPIKFSFTLLCKRLKQSEIDEEIAEKDRSTNEFLDKVVVGWEDIVDAENTRVEFSKDALDNLLEIPAMRTLCFHAYLKEVGAVAKN